jgi:two-component system chemotaxis response regulator CheB
VVVRELLRTLPAPLPVPVALVQHIMPGFIEGFAGWLESETGHRVRLVNEAIAATPGVVFVAKDSAHLRLTGPATLAALEGPPIDNQRPSIDCLFESAAGHLGNRAAAVLMTGMGRDGARGMRALVDAGALTIAQHPDTCAVASMPLSAIALGAAHMIRSPDGVAAELCKLLGLTSP